MQTEIDKANKDFWRELCGTSLAKSLNIESHDRASINKFDQAYMEFYPYLEEIIRKAPLTDARVLEIGLGYGTVSRLLAGDAKEFVGLDISDGPVGMVNHSLGMFGLKGKAIVGSALSIPFEDNHFDSVISIGCLHHTGNLKRAIAEVSRVLKPGGVAVIMVYNSFSFRQWSRWPIATLKRFFKEVLFMKRESNQSFSSTERKAYDTNQAGEGAPATEFTSKKSLNHLLKSSGFKSVRIMKMNSDDISYRGRIFISRNRALKTVGRILGLDLYVLATK